MNASMVRSSTVSGKHRSSSSNGASTTTQNAHTPRSDTDPLRPSQSQQNHPLSTGGYPCNNLSLRLVQNIGQVNLAGCGYTLALSLQYLNLEKLRHNLLNTNACIAGEVLSEVAYGL